MFLDTHSTGIAEKVDPLCKQTPVREVQVEEPLVLLRRVKIDRVLKNLRDSQGEQAVSIAQHGTFLVAVALYNVRE